MMEVQSTREAREAEQPSMLHFFVDVGVTSPGAAPVRNSKQEKGIRAHVMRDYLQQKAKSSESRNTSSALSKLSDHLNQFRLPSRRARERSRHGSKKLSSDQHAPTLKPIVPKSQQSMHEVVLARSLANDTLPVVPSPIDTSTPGALSLLEYYHTSFWDNSLACNPEGKWLSVAISDPAVLHATLCLVAIHKFQTRGGPQTNSYFWHRGEAMRLVSKNLADPAKASSDATIGAVSILSTSDNSVQWPFFTQNPHIEGMITLVRLRGGIDGMSQNRHIQRVTAWADILHSATHNSRPQLGVSHFPGHEEMERLMKATTQLRCSKAFGPNVVPAYFRKISEALQTLAMARTVLAKQAISNPQAIRPIFSDLLFVTEYRILELGHTTASPGIMMGDATGAEAVKAAALIFCFYGLRDLALTAAFYDSLIQRLYDGLCGISFEEGVLPVPLLLWLCLNGWKASTIKTRQRYREFFTEKAAILCESVGIQSQEDFDSLILTEYHPPACSGFWADMNAHTASSDTG